MDESKANVLSPIKSASLASLVDETSIRERNAISHPDLRKQNPESQVSGVYKWWKSQEINLGSSINIFNETDVNIALKENETENVAQKKKKETKQTFLEKFVAFFDLTLLKDPIFVNILCGLSLASCVETNFSLLLPIILKDLMQFETADIATLMGVIGFSDTMFRFVAPFIGEWCHKPPRVMYLIALLLIIFTRTSEYYFYRVT